MFMVKKKEQSKEETKKSKKKEEKVKDTAKDKVNSAIDEKKRDDSSKKENKKETQDEKTSHEQKQSDPVQENVEKAKTKVEDMANEYKSKESVYTPTKEELEKYKIYAILGYFFFFIPLFVMNDSKYAKFHANQATVLFIINTINTIIAAVSLGLCFFIYIPVGLLAFAAMIMGMVNAANGECKPILVIGEWKILK